MSQWISVKDRLPEYIGWYLVYVERPTMVGYEVVACCNREGFHVPKNGNGEWIDILPTHWMPLPEPPKIE